MEQRMQMLMRRVGAAFCGVFPRQLEIQKPTNITRGCSSETSSSSAQARAVGLLNLSEGASEPPAWLSEQVIASWKAGEPSPASSHANGLVFLPGMVPPRLTGRGAMPEKAAGTKPEFPPKADVAAF